MIDVRTPAARSTDPQPSHDAAEQITDSGIRGEQQRATAEAVRQHPGCTSHELAEKSGLDRYALARRLPEVEVAGEVMRGQPRKCRVSGRRVTTWWPVPKQPPLALASGF